MLSISKTYFWLLAAIFLLGTIIFSWEPLVFVLFSAFLGAITILTLLYFGIDVKPTLILFVGMFLIHLVIGVLLYTTGFNPFGGESDSSVYHQEGVEIAQLLNDGTFSLEGVRNGKLVHAYGVLLGGVYWLSLPAMSMGLAFNAWASALAVLLLYFLMRFLGASVVWSAVAVVVAGIYPSFLFYGSLLLKDAVIVALSLGAVFLLFHLARQLSLPLLLGSYAFVLFATVLRVYLFYAFIGFLVIGWFFYTNRENWKNRAVLYASVLVFMGTAPVFAGYGYMGESLFREYFYAERITYYREEVYASKTEPVPVVTLRLGESIVVQTEELSTTQKEPVPSVTEQGKGSTINLETNLENPLRFFQNYLSSLTTTIFGPFPWQVTGHQRVALAETAFLWVIYGFVVGGIVHAWRKKKEGLALLVFAVLVFAPLALYVANLGALSRARITGVLILFVFIPLCLEMLSERFPMLRRFENRIKILLDT